MTRLPPSFRDIEMTSPDFYLPSMRQPKKSIYDVTKIVSTSPSYGFLPSSRISSTPHYPNFGPPAVHDHSIFSPSNSSSNSSDSGVTSSSQTEDQVSWIPQDLEYSLASVLSEDHVTNNFPQASNEIPWCTSPLSFDHLLVSDLTNPEPGTSSLDQVMEESFQTSCVGPYPYIPLDMPPSDWGTGLLQAGFSSGDSHTFDFADPTVEFDGLSGENLHMIDGELIHHVPHTPSGSSSEELILSVEPVCLCKWKDADGTICRDPLTPAILPEHLAKHGIKKRTRNHPTKCNWDGCKRKKSMNRESIVRHIREVHLHLKRPSKRVEEF